MLGLFLAVGGAVVLVLSPESMKAGFATFGYPADTIAVVASLEALSGILLLIPRTSPIGAAMVTAYLGGATATHVRIHDPSWVMPVVAGVLLWVGMYLSDPRVRALAPWASK